MKAKKEFHHSMLAMAGAFAIAMGISGVGVSAHAQESSVGTADPSKEVMESRKLEAINGWEENNNEVAKPAAEENLNGISLYSLPQRTTELYRGSWLMWAKERVDFTYDFARVVHSNGWQESGAVFPNNVTRHGTSNVLATKTQHQWRGSYTVGAGVPTPWGNANVYNATSTARMNVNANGAWNAWWVD